jgi:hypothetical protein
VVAVLSGQAPDLHEALQLLLGPCRTITRDHHRPRRRALQVPAHQSGSFDQD